ncbi:NEDD8-conjugating enzyme-like protein [Lachnellula arida]|uniref:NEDD8-conjugating enzyme-like protein n=1 Tax=Lachnellula arida TaxID=1316785 RepID=A0A8T9B302_9HELO|nr:NEDD8-conjugating enzyme-like protein [Lachnellula arida]
MASILRHRLLQDIAEMQTKPYPNIELHLEEHDISTACLVLTTEGYGPMHLTVCFNDDYPLNPPTIYMDSKIEHPNIKEEGNICASILETKMDYTPAYTLKGIAMQLLSFFASDRIQQVIGDFWFDLDDFRALHLEQNVDAEPFVCESCHFGTIDGPPASTVTSVPAPVTTVAETEKSVNPAAAPALISRGSSLEKVKLPNEMLLLICDFLETEELLSFAEAWPRIGDVINEFNVIRTRELRCFCLKKDYITTKLGVGIAVTKEEKGNMDFVSSEFDILSQDAFELGVRRSVQGVPFKFWLPLPISENHWERVKGDVDPSLAQIAHGRGYGNVASEYVLFRLLNDIIIKLSKENEQTTYKSPIYPYEETAKSTLTHASEKAIEFYFHIFHLLICKATEEPEIVAYTKQLILDFESGQTGKEYVSNIGHLLIATLISDVDISTKIIRLIITEAVTRNAIRVLQKYPELAYREPGAISEYRLDKSFLACKPSYRILMFLHHFRKIAIGTPRKSMHELRTNAFARHGAPPPGGAKSLAQSIRNIHKVNNFRDFFLAMDMPGMTKEWHTSFLRDRMGVALQLGYCAIPFSQEQAMSLRRDREPGVPVVPGYFFINPPKPEKDGVYNFKAGRGGKGGARGGRGRGRGRGR